MRPPSKKDSFLLSKEQWKKVFLAMTILTILLYIVAAICSVCGLKTFILNYQNTQMDNIEIFSRQHKLIPAIAWLFSSIEFFIISSFIIKKPCKWYYVLSFYVIPLIFIYAFNGLPDIVQSLIPIAFYLAIILIENRPFNWKQFWAHLAKLLIAIVTTLFLQAIICFIKAGEFSFKYVDLGLSGLFIYSIEYDIALSVILFTVLLFIDGEKGDSKQWTELTVHGGSSQILMTQSQPSLQKKNLTKKQKNRLRWLLAKTYLIQIGTLLLVFVLPFLLGKVLEFTVTYLSFAIIRYILGFKYSLHFKKEALCISASLVIFGIISLAVPFFYVVLVVAVLMGAALAVFLHLSYKYRSLWLFQKVSKVDKFATLYAFFDGDLSEYHIKMICRYKGLDHFQSSLIYNFMRGEKISYLAFKFNYSHRMLIYKLDEAINKLLA